MNSLFPAEHKPITLYRHPLSGHAHRVELLLSLLDIPYEMVDVDLMAGEHKAPEFLAKNAFGVVPVIEDNGVTLSESTAILVYLASRYAGDQQWLPSDPVEAAPIYRWLSVAAGDVINGPAAIRLARLFGQPLDYDAAKRRTESLFAVLEALLAEQSHLVGSHASLADIAVYPYAAHVEEGGVSLQAYPAIRAWLARIESLPRFVGMLRSASTVDV